MGDIFGGCVTLASLSAAAILVGRRLARSRRLSLCAALSLLVAIGYAFFLYDRLVLAWLVPVPGIAVLGNGLLLPLSVFLSALVAPSIQGTVWRKAGFLPPLVALGAWHAFGPLAGAPPATVAKATLTDGVVRQTSESTCSAASAATLLIYAGIPASESELAALCFTRSAGTPMLGTFRGLAKKCKGAPFGVRVLSWATVAELKAACRTGPVMLSVGLDRWQRGYDPRYVTEWGWSPGSRHAIVLFGFLPGGKLDIGDPSVGREKWDEDALAVLWNGEGVPLVRRGG